MFGPGVNIKHSLFCVAESWLNIHNMNLLASSQIPLRQNRWLIQTRVSHTMRHQPHYERFFSSPLRNNKSRQRRDTSGPFTRQPASLLLNIHVKLQKAAERQWLTHRQTTDRHLLAHVKWDSLRYCAMWNHSLNVLLEAWTICARRTNNTEHLQLV